MCMPKAPKPPKPPAPPPTPNESPDAIENSVDSNAEQRKKKRSGSKQLRRGSSGTQTSGSSSGTGLTIKGTS